MDSFQSKDIKTVVRTLKCLNILAGLLTIVLYPIVLVLDIDDKWQPQKLTLIIYTILFGLLLIIFELNCCSSYFMKYYGFMYSYMGRTAFMIFLGSLCCLINHVLSFVIASVVVTIAALNLFVICTRAEFKKGGLYSIWTNPNLGQKAFSENAKKAGLDYAKNNPDQVRKAAKAGMDFAKDNPDVAAAGFNAAVGDDDENAFS